MPLISLETAIGATAPVPPEAILYNSIDNPKKLLLTANFARNVQANNGGYVLIYPPDNIEGLLLGTVASQEAEKAAAYVRGIEEWNKREKAKLDDCWLEQEIRKETGKAPLELLLKAMADKGEMVSSMLSTFQQTGALYPNQQRNLLKMLGLRGMSGDAAQGELRVLLEEGKKPCQETWGALADKFKIEELVSSAPPQLQLREFPPLIQELEKVVMRAYNGESLEGAQLISQAWEGAGISPELLYGKVRGSIKSLAGQFALVKVLGISRREGDIRPVHIISNPPKVLRPYYIRPAHAADDAFALGSFVQYSLNQYFINNQEGREIIETLRPNKRIFLLRAVFEMLFGKSWLNANLLHSITIPESEIDKGMTDYIETADKIYRKILSGEVGNGDVGGVVVTKPLISVADVVRSLVGAIPDEVYEARMALYLTAYAVQKEADPKFKGTQGMEMIKAKAAYHAKNLPDITKRLGHTLSKEINRLTVFGTEETVANALTRYGLAAPA